MPVRTMHWCASTWRICRGWQIGWCVKLTPERLVPTLRVGTRYFDDDLFCHSPTPQRRPHADDARPGLAVGPHKAPGAGADGVHDRLPARRVDRFSGALQHPQETAISAAGQLGRVAAVA